MTLLNTLANLGAKWPATLVLFLEELLTPRGCVGAEKPSSTRGVHYLTRRRRALRGIVVARGAAAPFAHDTGDAREEICARLRVGTERAGRAVLRRPVFLEGRPPVRVFVRPLRCHFWPMPFMLKTYDL